MGETHSNSHMHASAGQNMGHTPFAASALDAAVLRTLLLVAAIVAVSLIISRMEPSPVTGSTGVHNNAGPAGQHAARHQGTLPAETGGPQPAQGKAGNRTNNTVTVNGEAIPVPADGNLHKTVTTDTGTTTVNLSNSTSGGNVQTSTNISIESSGGTAGSDN